VNDIPSEVVHLDAVGAGAERPAVEDLYCRAYAERVASGDPFGTPEAFMERFDAYIDNPGFSMLVITSNGRWIGQAWGWPLMPTSRWWTGIQPDPGPDFTTENGYRTFALSEIMVARDHTGRGLAHRLHDLLLASRPEQRATLLVNPANERARTSYLRWGWTPVATLRPHWPNAPLLDVLTRPLTCSEPGVTDA